MAFPANNTLVSNPLLSLERYTVLVYVFFASTLAGRNFWKTQFPKKTTPFQPEGIDKTAFAGICPMV
jgi:hypothetical protein